MRLLTIKLTFFIEISIFKSLIAAYLCGVRLGCPMNVIGHLFCVEIILLKNIRIITAHRI